VLLECFAMPSDYGFRLDDDQALAPSTPNASKPDPEEPVRPSQFRPSILLPEHCQLLAQSHVLKNQIAPGLETGTGRT